MASRERRAVKNCCVRGVVTHQRWRGPSLEELVTAGTETDMLTDVLSSSRPDLLRPLLHIDRALVEERSERRWSHNNIVSWRTQ